MLVSEKQTEILNRPGFRFLNSTSVGAMIIQSIQAAQQEFYEEHLTTNRRYHNVTPIAGLTIPTGTAVAFGANGKQFELTTATTDAIPADLAYILNMWVTNTGAEVFSSSTYDGIDSIGNGIPDLITDPALDVNAVFHELVNTGTSMKLRMYIGNTTSGGTPKLHMKYIRTINAVATGSDIIDIPEALLSQFDTILNGCLVSYIGFSG
jgi:hypothetical protein